jgi:hypothetical protein
MFNSLRPENVFYVLKKNRIPVLSIGRVVKVSNPVPKYNTSFQTSINGFETVVDVLVNVDGVETEFKQLPANKSIFDYEGGTVIVSDDKNAINSEVESLLNYSQNIIDNVEYHQKVIQSCSSILTDLNPQIAKEKKQEEKINNLESKMLGIENTLTDVKNILTQLTNK